MTEGCVGSILALAHGRGAPVECGGVGLTQVGDDLPPPASYDSPREVSLMSDAALVQKRSTH